MTDKAPFNARAARAKRPCPIWVDAFQRDTQHLEADEVGAYFLILMAMWTRESCDFPNDDNRLSRVSRVSLRLWKSRIGPVIRAFLTPVDGVVVSKRLRQEADYVESEVQKQSDRKRGTYAKPGVTHNSDDENGENPHKPLENNDPPLSADMTADQPGNHPSQQPNNPTYKKEAAAAVGERVVLPPDATWREQVMAAMGADPSGIVNARPTSLGSRIDMLIAGKWETDLGLSRPVILDVIRDRMSRKSDGPPASFKYFTPMMQAEAARQAEPALEPTPQEDKSHDRPTARDRRSDAASDALARRLDAAARTH